MKQNFHLTHLLLRIMTIFTLILTIVMSVDNVSAAQQEKTQFIEVDLGGINIDEYCKWKHPAPFWQEPSTAELVGEKTSWNAYSWSCRVVSPSLSGNGVSVEYLGIDLNEACRLQKKDDTAYARPVTASDPLSWRCYKQIPATQTPLPSATLAIPATPNAPIPTLVPPTKIILTQLGEWIGTNYRCGEQYYSERVRLELQGNNYMIATKVDGDPCIGAGQRTWEGTYNNPAKVFPFSFLVKLWIKDANGQMTTVNRTAVMTDPNRIEIQGGSYVIVFTNPNAPTKTVTPKPNTTTPTAFATPSKTNTLTTRWWPTVTRLTITPTATKVIATPPTSSPTHTKTTSPVPSKSFTITPKPSFSPTITSSPTLKPTQAISPNVGTWTGIYPCGGQYYTERVQMTWDAATHYLVMTKLTGDACIGVGQKTVEGSYYNPTNTFPFSFPVNLWIRDVNGQITTVARTGVMVNYNRLEILGGSYVNVFTYGQ